MSADGKIGTAAFDHVSIGSRLDRDVMSVLRAQADAVSTSGFTRGSSQKRGSCGRSIVRVTMTFHQVRPSSGAMFPIG